MRATRIKIALSSTTREQRGLPMPQHKRDGVPFPTETIILRGIDRELWKQFKDVCQMQGVTASQKIRQMIWETAKEGGTTLFGLPGTG
jgi:hypothetical protein